MLREIELERGIHSRFAELLNIPRSKLKTRDLTSDAPLILETGSQRFIVECKTGSSTPTILQALRQVKEFASKHRGKCIPLLAVPFMGETGSRLCAEAGVGWFDFSGNAHLEAPGLRIHVQGKPNAFKSPGRPRTVFAPRSSRIARWLLIHPKESITQQDLATATGVGRGFTSRIIRRLEELDLVTRGEKGRWALRDFNAMLEAWRGTYEFSRHQIIRGQIAERSSEETLRSLASGLQRAKMPFAATGLTAAWLLTKFAAHRLVTLYLERPLTEEMRRKLRFHEVERGENVWLVVPTDDGVFQGASERDGIRCVHPVQVYMDLKGHPERADEAAARLREQLLRKDA